MATIHDRSDVPNDTYFRVGDCEPEITEEGEIQIYNGRGTSRSWGTPSVTSTVVVDAMDFVAIHVGFSHKHGGGQFWRYYTINGSIYPIGWRQLPDTTRQIVLDAYVEEAPAWAKSPGKLRTDYINPASHKMRAYKMVAVDEDGAYVSLYDASTKYEIGKRRVQMARPDHNGGYYSYPDIDGLKNTWQRWELMPRDRHPEVATLAILEVEISGTHIAYGDKISSTYLTPMAEVERFDNDLIPRPDWI